PPTVELIPQYGVQSLAWYTKPDGTLVPAARHNYCGPVYMPSVKRVWQGSGIRWWDSGSCGPKSWETDVQTGAVTPSDPPGVGTGFGDWNTHPEIQSVWATSRVLYVDYGRLRAYDPTKPAGSRVLGVDADEGNGLSDGRYREMSPLWDSKRGRVVLIGSHEQFTVCVWEPTGATYRRRVQPMAHPFNARYVFGQAPLVAYDPIGDRYWVVPYGGRTIYEINPETWAVTDLTQTTGDTPDASHQNGTYNRGGYLPSLDALVVVHKVQGGAWAWKPKRGASPPVVIPPGPVPGLKERVFTAFEQPPKGSGPSAEMKHCTMTWCPPAKAFAIAGGDYDGGSYDQRVWRFSLRERIASTDPKAGWRLEVPFCVPPGGVMPKSPDHIGFPWDSKRSLFWHVPGQYNPPSLPVQCAGITQDGSDNPGYLYGHLMQYRPLEADPAKRWADFGLNPGPD